MLVKAPEFWCKDAAKVLFTTQPDAMLHQMLCLNQEAISFVDKFTTKVDQGAPVFCSQAPRFWSIHQCIGAERQSFGEELIASKPLHQRPCLM